MIIFKEENGQINFRKVKYFHEEYLILCDVSKKMKDSYSLIFLSKNKNSKNEIFVYKLLISKFDKFEEIKFYSKIKIDNFTQNKFTEKYFKYSNDTNFNNFDSTNIFMELKNSYFVIVFPDKIFLFEKFNKYAIDIQNLDISFMDMVFPLNLIFSNSEFENFGNFNFKENDKINLNDKYSYNDNNYLYLLSSKKYLYKIYFKLQKKETEYLPIFKDISLNFNNTKFRDFTNYLKFLIVYNLEIKKIPFEELSKQLNWVFHEFDIFSYVENMMEIISFENIIFFLNHNFASSKIFILLLFCLIYNRHDFIRKIFMILIKLENYIYLSADRFSKEFDLNDKDANEINDDFNISKEFVIYYESMISFFKEFSLEFNTVDFLYFVEKFFEKVFDELNKNTYISDLMRIRNN